MEPLGAPGALKGTASSAVPQMEKKGMRIFPLF